MTLRTGGRILVDQLKIQGCARIFTVPGESFLAVLDALYDTPEIDLTVCRQEGGVAYMADADGKMTGRPGVAFVTRGPGATNASGGVHVALQDSTPMILFVGDVDWSPRASHHFANFAFRYGIPVAAAFRRQDAICNTCQVYAGQLGYGPNPKLQQRIREADVILAVGPRLGEATTDGYTLITPEHPGQTLVHVHPDPNELGSVYVADLPICADMGEFAEMLDDWVDPDLVRFSCGEEAHSDWLEWSEP